MLHKALAIATLAATVVAVSPALAADAAPAPGPTAAPDWGARLAGDAQALHDTFEDSHPGPVDTLNPRFARALDDGLKQALKRAKTARTYGAYWWAMREYVAGFDDGHVGLGVAKDFPTLATRWPGFLTRFDGDRQVVAVRLDEAAAPPLGAELLSCDGRGAAKLAVENVGRFRGRWFLASQRAQHGGRLFLDADNPWIAVPKTCVFREDGKPKTYPLAWRKMPNEEVGKWLGQTTTTFRAPIERRAFGDGGVWISAGSFNGEPGSDPFKALTVLLAGLEADRDAVRGAKIIVLDVRGNGGGSSRWPYRMAQIVFGDQWVEDHEPTNSGVEWRVSEANLASITEFAAAMRKDGADAESLRWADTIVAGLTAARAKGQRLWSQHDTAAPPSAPTAPASPGILQTRAKVFILTDPACGSACLDAVDTWKAAGAVQVGQETSADTLYMEIRDQTLPSGATISVPMKVYRGRPRGNNEPQRPAHVFGGRMDDTAALEAWILGLAAQ